MIVGAFKSLSLTVLLGLSVLSGCSSQHEVSYSQMAPVAARSDWRLTKVDVRVPDALTTTEKNSYMPNADVVWHGDPVGDRKAQVAAVVKDGVELGLMPLKGRKSVVATATVSRFHALTPKAFYKAPRNTGVHSVNFDLVISDARSGAVLSGPVAFSVDMPASMSGDLAGKPDQAPGPVWKKEIRDHIAYTLRCWLGLQTSNRRAFSRIGR
jgi:hypothetical protein